MKAYTLESLTARVPLGEYRETCVDVEKFLGLCRQCPNYGKIWACPPLSLDPMEIWNRYEILELHAGILTPGENMSMEELMEAFRLEKLRLSRQVLDLERKIPGSLSMAASTCIECSPCLRTLGKPCCHPEQLRYSIEARGGDVGLTMEKYLGHPIQWAKPGEIPPYMTVAAGLLLPGKGKRGD